MLKGQIIGHLGRDAEVKPIGDMDLLVFTIASTEKYTKQGQEVSETTWVNCARRMKDASKLAGILRKGMKIYAEGTLRMSSYTTQSGETRSDLQMNVQSIEFMDSPNQQGQQQQQYPQQQQRQQQQPQYPQQQQQSFDDIGDGLPF